MTRKIKFRDSYGSILSMDMSKVDHIATAPNGGRQEWFAMYKGKRDKETVFVSSLTLSVLPKVRRKAGGRDSSTQQ